MCYMTQNIIPDLTSVHIQALAMFYKENNTQCMCIPRTLGLLDTLPCVLICMLIQM